MSGGPLTPEMQRALGLPVQGYPVTNWQQENVLLNQQPNPPPPADPNRVGSNGSIRGDLNQAMQWATAPANYRTQRGYGPVLPTGDGRVIPPDQT